MLYVLDACAMIAYVRGEPGSEVLEEMFSKPGHQFQAHSVNMAEVYYHFLWESGEQDAERAVYPFEHGMSVREDGDPAFWREVARIKAPGGISLADCFCVALARRLGATIISTDRKEFEPLVDKGTCSVVFLR